MGEMWNKHLDLSLARSRELTRFSQSLCFTLTSRSQTVRKPSQITNGGPIDSGLSPV
ncbi:hypothetical protein COMA2_80185 [Candidatus Nitrospira nitrificans]|uniref:Uncharacterized protein n=1 Tax=Candidatus Nitrospira nitrificans TaxID=1742973 RepID=A0A0S4LUV0_9BACT|nr:hypothetical protein COMA2_80185 [Candidatus Nitrospira nitrificans]